MHRHSCPAGNPSVLNSAKDVLRFVTFQRPPTVPHVILDGVNGVLKPGERWTSFFIGLARACQSCHLTAVDTPRSVGIHSCSTRPPSRPCMAAWRSCWARQYVVSSVCVSFPCVLHRPHDAAAGPAIRRQVGAAAGAQRAAAVGAQPAGELFQRSGAGVVA